MKDPAIAHPAATVVLLRDGGTACEVLLVQRNQQLSFHGGAWVFPGGRIDAEDYDAAGSEDPVAAARHAAVREAREEAGLGIAVADLLLISRWVTPELSPKRFDTWFFAAPAGSEAVQVDGGEIHAHRWITPGDALAAHGRGEIDLPPPTFVTLSQLTGFANTREAFDRLAQDGMETFLPRLQPVADGACCLYPDDVAYDAGDLDRPGPRHRLWMLESGWRYERNE